MARIQGLEKLSAKLKALRTQTAAAVRPAVGQAADVVVAMQKHLVPVESGDLRSSIKWQFGEGAIAASQGFAGRKSVNETRAVITAGGPEAPYAPFVEFGTSSMPAKPFFFPGYRATKKRAKAIIAKAVKVAVQKAAG